MPHATSDGKRPNPDIAPRCASRNIGVVEPASENAKEQGVTPTIRSEDIDGLKFINPAGLYDPKPNAYSHLAVFPAGWRVILPAGQGGETEHGVLSPDFATQPRQALTNTEIVLAAAGARMSDIAKFNLLIVDHSEEKFAAVRKEFDRVWGESKPPWTLIPVPTLALKGMLVEIDVIAVVPR
jgi:enamine deaminase RidA (YjgF/YER057c/UK114 family)